MKNVKLHDTELDLEKSIWTIQPKLFLEFDSVQQWNNSFDINVMSSNTGAVVTNEVYYLEATK